VYLGTIPSQLSELTRLIISDFSTNQLTGKPELPLFRTIISVLIPIQMFIKVGDIDTA
jgi:hypothetical protein